jgi:ElaB/YqjD/DUF883 family membrane-anchored ribosome-binding protein
MVSASTRLLEGKVDRLSDISGQTLAQVGSIIGRFDDHSKVLGQASHLLAAAQSGLVSTLEEREGALQTLAAGLVQRSAEIEKTMRGLGGMIETVFERAEQRSNQVTGTLRQSVQASFADIGRVLADTEKRAEDAASTMRDAINRAGEEANATIDTSFANVERRSGDLSNRLRGGLTASLSEVERMLGEAGRASDNAAQSLRESLRDAIDEAVGRFSGATEEIRRSATDIRNELDATRAELKRGAFDLPEEAKESASAMRRAVAEQIKALQDISQIVGRSSQRLELSEPVARTLAQAEPAPRVVQPVIPTAPAPQPAPTARQSIESMGLRGTITPTPAAAPAPAPAPAPQRPVAQAP